MAGGNSALFGMAHSDREGGLADALGRFSNTTTLSQTAMEAVDRVKLETGSHPLYEAR